MNFFNEECVLILTVIGKKKNKKNINIIISNYNLITSHFLLSPCNWFWYENSISVSCFRFDFIFFIFLSTERIKQRIFKEFVNSGNLVH